MGDTKITINGRRYDSRESMPPDVRLIYEEAMRSLDPRVASGLGTHTHAAPLGGELVVNRVVHVNEHRYGSLDELPPEVRRMYDEAMRGATSPVTRPETSVHVSVNLADGPSRSSGLRQVSDLESTIRGIPGAVATLVVLGLIAWYFLSR